MADLGEASIVRWCFSCPGIQYRQVTRPRLQVDSNQVSRRYGGYHSVGYPGFTKAIWLPI